MNELEDFLRTCLPEKTRIETVSRGPHSSALRFTDEMGQQHIVEWWEVPTDRRYFRAGEHLAFAYRPLADSSLDQRVIVALLGQEKRLLALARGFVEPPEEQSLPGRPLFLRETTLAWRILRALPAAKSIPRAVHMVLDEAFSADETFSEVQIYFETRCRQACEFCEEPKIRDRIPMRAVQRLLVLQHDLHLDLVSSGAFAAILDFLADRGLPVMITGHDWLRHPHWEKLLCLLETHPRTRLRLQGPSLDFEDLSLARRIAALKNLTGVVTTLQSSDPIEHDAMVGTPGAFARLVRALENLTKLSVGVHISLVLTRRALRSLPETLHFLQKRGWLVELSAFVPDHALGDVRDKLAPHDDLRGALEMALPAASEVVRSIVGVPPCAVPEALQSKVAPVLRTRERAPLQFSLVCRGCTAFGACSGVPAGYLQAFGTRGISPLQTS